MRRPAGRTSRRAGAAVANDPPGGRAVSAAEKRGESLAGRAWDIFFMFTLAARMAKGHKDLTFEVIHTNAKGRNTTAEIFATFDRMGDGSPVIKFMFPSER